MAMQAGFIKRIRDIMRMDAGINGDAQRIEQMVWMLFLKVYDAKEDDWELNEDDYISIIPENLRWRNWARPDANGHAMTGDKLLDFVNNTLFPVLKGIDVKDGEKIIYEGIKVTPDTPVKKAIVKSTFEDANNYMKDGVYLRQVVDIIDEIEFDDVKESHAFGFVYEEILKDLQSAGSSGEFYTPRAVTDFMALMIKPRLGEKMADFACGTGGFITSWLGQLSKQVNDTSAQKQLDDSIYGVEKKPFPYLLCVTNMLLHDIEVPNIYHMNSLKHNLLDYTDDDKFDVILMNPPYGGHEDKSIQGFFPDDLASSETADLFMSVIMYRLRKNGRAAVVVPDGFLFGLDNAKVSIKRKLLTDFNLHTIIRLPESVFSPYTSISTNLLFFDNTSSTKETWYYRVDIPTDRKHFSKTRPMELSHFNDCISWWNDRKEITLGDGPKALKFDVDFLLNEQGCNFDLCGYPHEEENVLSPEDTIFNSLEIMQSVTSEITKASNIIISMLKNEDIIPSKADIEKSCSQLLSIATNYPTMIRKSILQYAIQGKLVEQRMEEGNANDLFLKLKDIKAQKVKLKEIKAEKPLQPMNENDIPFDIPDNWIWCNIQDIFFAHSAMRIHQSDWKTDGIPFFRGRELVRLAKTGDPNAEIFISEEFYNELKDKGGVPKKDDILISAVGTLGKVYVVKGTKKFYYKDAYILCLDNYGVDPYYIKYLVESPYIQNYIYGDDAYGTTVAQLTLEKLKKMIIPLPPLEEQHRIVKKIEELLPYCDSSMK